MLREGLIIRMEYREAPGYIPYYVNVEFPVHTIEMANKDFMYMLGEETKHMWLKLEREIFNSAG